MPLPAFLMAAAAFAPAAFCSLLFFPPFTYAPRRSRQRKLDLATGNLAATVFTLSYRFYPICPEDLYLRVLRIGNTFIMIPQERAPRSRASEMQYYQVDSHWPKLQSGTRLPLEFRVIFVFFAAFGFFTDLRMAYTAR